jgi:hypothetical protein
MGLYKRICVSTANFVTTGQTGNFITTNQTGQFGSSGQFSGIVNFTGFPAFGINPHAQNSGEMILSNSYYPSGATQFSYFVCSRDTEGVDFNGNQGRCVGCFDINLRKNYTNQAWLIKSSLIGIGQHWNGDTNQHFSIDSSIFVYSDFENSYNINGPYTTIYTKTQNSFSIGVQTGVSGIIFKVCDSPITKMKWTNKIEVIQSIYEEEINLLTTQEQIENFFQNAISPQSSATEIQILNLDGQIPELDAGEDPGALPTEIFDGEEDLIIVQTEVIDGGEDPGAVPTEMFDGGDDDLFIVPTEIFDGGEV